MGYFLFFPNNLIVGYPLILYLVPAPGSVVISTAPKLTIPERMEAACSNSGADCLQCPHHGAVLVRDVP
jgi:hypothetical protein